MKNPVTVYQSGIDDDGGANLAMYDSGHADDPPRFLDVHRSIVTSFADPGKPERRAEYSLMISAEDSDLSFGMISAEQLRKIVERLIDIAATPLPPDDDIKF